jgi:hypothetical protein
MRLKFLPVFALAALAAGCAAKVEAETPEPPLPTLEAPPAPPRIIAIYEDPAPVPSSSEVTLEGPPAPEPPPSRPPRAETPSEPPPAIDPPRPPPSPPLTLTPAPGTEAQTEASIRTLLSRATRDLARVTASTLSVDGRTQYETSRRFLQQAEEALKTRNLVFAGKLADKAAAMAAVLVR